MSEENGCCKGGECAVTPTEVPVEQELATMIARVQMQLMALKDGHAVLVERLSKISEGFSTLNKQVQLIDAIAGNRLIELEDVTGLTEKRAKEAEANKAAQTAV